LGNKLATIPKLANKGRKSNYEGRCEYYFITLLVFIGGSKMARQVAVSAGYTNLPNGNFIPFK